MMILSLLLDWSGPSQIFGLLNAENCMQPLVKLSFVISYLLPLNNSFHRVPREAVDQTKRCDENRSQNPQDPEINYFNNLISDTVTAAARDTWTKEVESCSLKKNPMK
jgi:hypothetical protein